ITPSSPHPTPSHFFFHPCPPHRTLHSFPTRRSSDLRVLAETPDDRKAAIRRAYQYCFARLPSSEELKRAEDVAAISGLQTVCWRSEEHTSELQSRGHLVCRLLLEKKKTEPTVSSGNR